MSDDYIDYRLIRSQMSSELEEIITEGNLGEQLESVLRAVCVLPYPDIQFPIIASFIASPVTLMSTAGILFLWGSSGTGKSQVATVASELYKTTSVLANSTFASLRNKIQHERFYDPLQCEFEKNFILVWEDITPSLLIENENMLSLFKVLNRKNSRITISSQTPGTNMIFNAFALKVINSIHPLWTLWELNELKRRMFPIWFKKRETMTSEEYRGNSYELSDLNDVEDITLDKLSSQLEIFWRNIDNCNQYSKVKKQLQKHKKDIINARLSSEIIVTHSLIYQLSINESIKRFNDYWDFVNEKILTISSGTEQFLDSFITQSIEAKMKQNNQAINAGCPELTEVVTDIDPKALKEAIERAKTDGYLDSRVNVSELTNLMKSRGYSMINQNGKNVWKQII
ncbi:hypothetical protein [Limnospira platensis]|uniref:hypothetical protein n=1 Tax=Limnospira platensis TaxID=118562 RepID=UPI0001D0EB29|nr:hypothetical protein APPUASWS_009700 [Arthrospira platensis str. Paraca]MDF2213164.1 hypothetical protein [Arthrospira platensis NCB002]BAI91507.1 hypothetical protein NIES39_J04600 [Arthrospira platensis NIES-39]BDT13803.1 hypothetical protein N39L_35260 [Arthrospira platensis NIES-39]